MLYVAICERDAKTEPFMAKYFHFTFILVSLISIKSFLHTKKMMATCSVQLTPDSQTRIQRQASEFSVVKLCMCTKEY